MSFAVKALTSVFVLIMLLISSLILKKVWQAPQLPVIQKIVKIQSDNRKKFESFEAPLHSAIPTEFVKSKQIVAPGKVKFKSFAEAFQKPENLSMQDLAFIKAQAQSELSIDPHSYVAYKAHLAALFAEQALYKQKIPDGEYEEVFDELLDLSYSRPVPESNLEAEELDANQLEMEALIEEIAEVSDATDKDEFVAELAQAIKEDLSLMPDEGEGDLEEIFNDLMNKVQVYIGLEEVGSDEPLLEKIDPDLIHFIFTRFQLDKNYQEMGETAEEYIEEFPRSSLGHFYYAQALYFSGEQEDGLEALKQALRLDPQNPELLRSFLSAKKGKDPNEIFPLHLKFQFD